MWTATYSVDGMVCRHCVDAATTELSAIPGVTAVLVDLAAGTATVSATRALDHEAVRAAVEEAGLQLVGRPPASSGEITLKPG